MSRIGRQKVAVPEKVEVRLDDGMLRVKGPLGELVWELPRGISAEQKDKAIRLSSSLPPREGAANYGMARARLANLIEGVSAGFQKTIEIQGVGYKAAQQGDTLTLTLGFTHPVSFTAPKGVKLEVDKKATKITISGADKELVGQTAASLRALKPPEPYKGTGIRYSGERIHRKAGKTAAGAGGAAGGGGAKK